MPSNCTTKHELLLLLLLKLQIDNTTPKKQQRVNNKPRPALFRTSYHTSKPPLFGMPTSTWYWYKRSKSPPASFFFSFFFLFLQLYLRRKAIAFVAGSTSKRRIPTASKISIKPGQIKNASRATNPTGKTRPVYYYELLLHYVPPCAHIGM